MTDRNGGLAQVYGATFGVWDPPIAPGELAACRWWARVAVVATTLESSSHLPHAHGAQRVSVVEMPWALFGSCQVLRLHRESAQLRLSCSERGG